MTEAKRPVAHYVVLRQTGEGQWRFAGEVERRPGLNARAARA